MNSSSPSIALIHEWLIDWGGSEAVTAAIAEAFPGSQLHALIDFLSPRDRQRLGDTLIRTSFLQSLPGMRNRFWYYLWLMPYAVEKFDLRDVDLIISSSHAFAKGVITRADQLHVSYVHSPMRYAWDLYHDYLEDYGLTNGLRGALAHAMFYRLRQWDRASANNVDLFVANSAYVARRIWRTYRRPAAVLHPPVDVTDIPFGYHRDDNYLTVSRLVSYKRIDIIVQAFAQTPKRRLVIIGDGPERARLQAMATPNVHFLGYQPDTTVREHLARSRAFVFAAVEDFGISPVEAQAAGTPVIALGRGGALETVHGLDGRGAATGVFFPEQTVASLAAAIDCFEDRHDEISADACRENALRFSRERFVADFRTLVDDTYAKWRQGDRTGMELGQ